MGEHECRDTNEEDISRYKLSVHQVYDTLQAASDWLERDQQDVEQVSFRKPYQYRPEAKALLCQKRAARIWGLWSRSSVAMPCCNGLCHLGRCRCSAMHCKHLETGLGFLRTYSVFHQYQANSSQWLKSNKFL